MTSPGTTKNTSPSKSSKVSRISVRECMSWKYSSATMCKYWAGICCKKKEKKWGMEGERKGRREEGRERKRKYHSHRKCKSITMANLLIRISLPGQANS